MPENALPSWNPTKQRASQVVNILWVLKVKYIDGVFDKFKARAVFDGRDQSREAVPTAAASGNQCLTARFLV